MPNIGLSFLERVDQKKWVNKTKLHKSIHKNTYGFDKPARHHDVRCRGLLPVRSG